MRAVSLFSGVGGMDRGLQIAGIETVLQVEIDPWCRAVLARHFPGVERVSDVRDVCTDRGRLVGGDGAPPGGRGRVQESRDVDLVHGGFPCQDVSVAGNRAGLRGERSSLWFEFHRVLSELRPTWTVIENVPGLLSSNSGRDFGTVLSGLVELGYGVGWRTLDAQYFGVPQRRRRVFVVGCLGDAARAGAVLAVCAGCGGDPAAGGEAGQELAYSLAASAHGTGDGHGNAWNTTYVARPLTAGETGYRMDWETENFLVAAPLTAGGHPNSNEPGRHREDDENLIAFDWNASSTAQSPRAGDLAGVSAQKHDAVFIAFQPNSSRTDEEWRIDQSPPVKKGSGGDGAVPPAISGAQGVRRLTPLECERLQGFPDGWTETTDDGRAVPDSVRYRMLGNAVCCPVATWLGWRLRHVDALTEEASSSGRDTPVGDRTPSSTSRERGR